VTEGVASGIRLLAGRYQLGELLGRGGMADVYAGTDARLGRKVAIKLLRPALASDPAFRSRFRREAQDAAKMAHPSIVRIFDAGEETVTSPSGADLQVPFIIMEQVDGRTLASLIAKGPLDPHQAAGIAEQVLTALEYSHRSGLVHRDIKPGNIMITPTGQVKVMDFGIARAISETSATIAETSTIVGTAQYFSPEQARGEAVDARTDLYSTGIVLFEMLTGRAPFVGENPVAVAYQHVNQAAVRPSAINARVSPALDAVVLRAISKDRFERYQSAGDFRQELQAADSGTVAIKRPPPVPDFQATLLGVNPRATSGSDAAMRQLTVDDRTRGSRVRQSRPPVAWIWGGIAILAVIIVAVLYWTLNLASTGGLQNTSSISVPDVVGKTWEDASAILTKDKIEPVRSDQSNATVAAGTVISTSPVKGITVARGDTVTVVVSTGAAQVSVPEITGLTVAAATKVLLKDGFTVDPTVDSTHSPNVAAGVVTASTPTGGTASSEGTAVHLIASDGNVDVPDVRGQDFGDAASTLRGFDYQLTVDLVPDLTCSGDKVTAQSATGIQAQHADVTLTYCAAAAAPTPVSTP
jgi:eukaryotic-like serine/threonine-protein kinase